MYSSVKTEALLVDLFRKGSVKGTVALSSGNEATAVGMALPLRHGTDVTCLMHRDLGSHMVAGTSLRTLFCQYLANADSPTHAREGNVHHGNAAQRRFPMLSHLGNMLGPVVGGTWGARQNGEKAFGLAVIGDGGSSTGDFHESLNFASVRKVPVLFMIENNHYAFSTPTRDQYRCGELSDRATGYGITGTTIDGTDVWTVYSAVCDALDEMERTSLPCIIESMVLRLNGHAVYDTADYVSAEEHAEWMKREPLSRTRAELLKAGHTESELAALEAEIRAEVEKAAAEAIPRPRPVAIPADWRVFAPTTRTTTGAYKEAKVKNINAVNHALAYLLEREPRAFLVGQDIGRYGSAFKTCKGLFDRFGPHRVIDTPICESATVGFALGASQTGALPIVEFQFADFSTEAVTQLGLNTGSWFYRAGVPAPVLYRLPCGGGITLGAFHSSELEGLWSRFPGIKLLYPFTPQETFEAIVAGFYDQNPCIVFEHKLLYGSQGGDIDFDGDLTKVMRPRCHREGTDVTVIAWGAMLRQALACAETSPYSIEVWNPFIFNPIEWEPLLTSVQKTGRVVVVQESGETAGMGDRFVSVISRRLHASLKSAPVLVAALDVPVPFAPELEKAYLPNAENIATAVDAVMKP